MVKKVKKAAKVVIK
jgi:hypothetical protein